jgi:hypothetical protein
LPETGNTQPLTENGSISSFSLAYTLAGSNATISDATGSFDDIRLVHINICTEVEGDTYCFNNVVRPRNMGL